jgi:hypothetical protein
MWPHVPAKGTYRPGAVTVRRLGDLVRQYLRWAVCLGSISLALGLVLTGCAPAARPPHGPVPPGRWARFRHLAGVVDLAGPRGDGSFIVAAAGRLFTLTRAGVLRPFARGPGGYSTAIGPEPYIAMADGERVAGAGCSFPSGMIFALQPGPRPGIIAITPEGRASRFTSLPATLNPPARRWRTRWCGAAGEGGRQVPCEEGSHVLVTAAQVPGVAGCLALSTRSRRLGRAGSLWLVPVSW